MTMFNRELVKTQMIEMDHIVADPKMMQIARQLTLGRPSGMNAALDYYTELSARRSVDALGIFATYYGEYIAWCLFTYESDRYEFNPGNGCACAQVFVQPDYRRFGIGRQLIKLAAKLGDPDIVKVYSFSNYHFFNPIMKEHSHLHCV
jgi:GNAT superfamily N-acetyltransferase